LKTKYITNGPKRIAVEKIPSTPLFKIFINKAPNVLIYEAMKVFDTRFPVCNGDESENNSLSSSRHVMEITYAYIPKISKDIVADILY
jgi:hypothetical protein